MPRRRRPRKKGPAPADQAALEIPKTMSPQAEEALWEMLFAMHLAQAVEDHLEAEKGGASCPAAAPLPPTPPERAG